MQLTFYHFSYLGSDSKYQLLCQSAFWVLNMGVGHGVHDGIECEDEKRIGLYCQRVWRILEESCVMCTNKYNDESQ